MATWVVASLGRRTSRGRRTSLFAGGGWFLGIVLVAVFAAMLSPAAGAPRATDVPPRLVPESSQADGSSVRLVIPDGPSVLPHPHEPRGVGNIEEPAKVPVSVTALSGVQRLRAVPDLVISQTESPAGASFLVVEVKVTNLSPNYNLEAWPPPSLHGVFDVPRADVQTGYGQTTSIRPGSCADGPIPHRPDCIFNFFSTVVAPRDAPESAQYNKPIPPGGSGTLFLVSSNMGYFGAVPDEVPTGNMHVFFWDPQKYEKCTFGSSRTCRLPLSLELPLPGQQPLIPPGDARTVSTDADTCRIQSADAKSQFGFTAFSIKLGKTTDVETAWRSDGRWHVTERSDDEAGLVFGVGAKAGGNLGAGGADISDSIGKDIEVGGGLQWGSGVSVAVPTSADTMQLGHLFAGDLESDPAAHDAAEQLVSENIEETTDFSGADLEGSFGGVAGSYKASFTHTGGVKNYKNGAQGTVSTVEIDGSFDSSIDMVGFGADGAAVITAEAVVDNQYDPLAVVIKTEFALTASATVDLGKYVPKLPGTSLSLVNGIGTLTAKLDVSSAQNLAIGQRLLDDFADGAIARLVTDAPAFLGASTASIVLDSKPVTHAPGLDVAWGTGLRFGLTFGTTETEIKAAIAFHKDPNGGWQTWTACVPNGPGPR